MRWPRWCGGFCLLAVMLPTFTSSSVGATNRFFTVGFQRQWEMGEAIVPNFWGALANAKDGQLEPYEGGPNGMRQVQYFDKARMEQLTNTSAVTNGLLVNELISGKVQVGDNAFQQLQAVAIAIAGDPNNPGPTCAQLGTSAAALLTPAQAEIGGGTTIVDANCNNGEHTVIRWDSNGATAAILNGPDNRGAFSANIATGRVSLTGPLYRTQDPNCCASFRYARTWLWQNGGLAPETMSILPIEGGSALPVPSCYRAGRRSAIQNHSHERYPGPADLEEVPSCSTGDARENHGD